MSNYSGSLVRVIVLLLAFGVGTTACGQPQVSTTADQENAPSRTTTQILARTTEETITSRPSSAPARPSLAAITPTSSLMPNRTVETATPAIPLTFGDVPLPSLRSVNAPEGDIASGLVHLPRAWLIVHRQAFPATFGSFTWPISITAERQTVRHADAIEPERIPWLATATVGFNAQPVIIVNARATKQVVPQVRPWTKEPRYAPFTTLVPTAVQHNVDFAIFTLPPLSAVRDQLLSVSVTFEEGSIDYYWRLNPGSNLGEYRNCHYTSVTSERR